HKGCLRRTEIANTVDQKTLAVEEEEATSGLRLGQSGIHHGLEQQRRDTTTCRSRPENHDPLFGRWHGADIYGGEQCRGRDRRGSLDVVIERTQPIPITRQEPLSVRLGEILPLQQDVRPAGRYGG